jgi:hypothetical protein
LINLSNNKRALTVFINCPPGEELRDLRFALPMVVMASGLKFLCDFDSYLMRDPCVPNISNLADRITQSRYSIHVCDCCEIANPDKVGRFHLPVELGMALLERRRTAKDSAYHRVLILIQEHRPYAHFLSNEIYGEYRTYVDCEDAIKKVFYWLMEGQRQHKRPKLPSVIEAWAKFEKQQRTNRSRGEDELDEAALESEISRLLNETDWWKE